MFKFAVDTIDMTAAEILNYYRNLYYAEPQVTEHGIVANAINDYFKDVVPSIELYNELDRFKNDLVHTFIELCRGNDYNKLTLLKIGDTIDAIYDKHIADLNDKYPEDEK